MTQKNTFKSLGYLLSLGEILLLMGLLIMGMMWLLDENFSKKRCVLKQDECPMNFAVFSRSSALLFVLFTPINVSYASLYVGGSILNIVNHYFPTYLKLGSSELSYTTNGISLNLGYKFRKDNIVLAPEFDVGSFFDADGNLFYKNNLHYVNSTYYLAIKGKAGVQIKPSFMVYGLLGLSQNSIGDKAFESRDFNVKQVSMLFGGGFEYYPKRDSRIAYYPEIYYFIPTRMNLSSGGSGPASDYTMSLRGTILQLGVRYHFD